jgi:Putative collagen-binding domain of a collagenase
VRMAPDGKVIARVTPGSTSARALSEPARAYAIYAHGGHNVTLALELPHGQYRAEWLDPRTGKVEKTEELDGRGGRVDVTSPRYEEDVALRIRRIDPP